MSKRTQPRSARRMTRTSMKRTKGGHSTGALRNVSNNNFDKPPTPAALGTIETCL